LQGAKRISEVLRLTTDKIDYKKREIMFPQSKTRGTKVETIVSFPQSIMNELKEYIGTRKGLVFLTRNGKRIMINQVATTYGKVGERAGLMVHTHMLRCSAITYLLGQGFQPSEVAKVTGQTLPMVTAYDKRSKADNPTKKVSLVQ
jgi:integrase